MFSCRPTTSFIEISIEASILLGETAVFLQTMQASARISLHGLHHGGRRCERERDRERETERERAGGSSPPQVFSPNLCRSPQAARLARKGNSRSGLRVRVRRNSESTAPAAPGGPGPGCAASESLLPGRKRAGVSDAHPSHRLGQQSSPSESAPI
jgi:hypothetical protein